MINFEGFEKYLIVDLEATCCDKGTIRRDEMEIIEIGAVMIDGSTYNILDEYTTFIKPIRNPVLTHFCTKLTSIIQAQVDSACGYQEAVLHFKNWLDRYQDFAFCSWGDYDKNQLDNDCRYHNIPMPIVAPHFNIKQLFSIKQGLKKKLGLDQALDYIGVTLEGTHHRGIDDARNMVKLMPYIAS